MLMRFNGVATKYLHNDLGWHRWLDSHIHRRTQVESLIAMAIGL